jgi:hypothetical protein
MTGYPNLYPGCSRIVLLIFECDLVRAQLNSFLFSNISEMPVPHPKPLR